MFRQRTVYKTIALFRHDGNGTNPLNRLPYTAHIQRFYQSLQESSGRPKSSTKTESPCRSRANLQKNVRPKCRLSNRSIESVPKVPARHVFGKRKRANAAQIRSSFTARLSLGDPPTMDKETPKSGHNNPTVLERLPLPTETDDYPQRDRAIAGVHCIAASRLQIHTVQ